MANSSELAALDPPAIDDLDPRFITEVAYGLETPEDVGRRYGLQPQQVRHLLSNESFRAQLEGQIAELKRSGYTTKTKARVVLEQVIGRISAIHDALLPQDLIDAGAFLAKVAGADKHAADAPAQATPAFSLTINMGTGQQVNITANPGARPAGDPDVIEA